MSILDLFKNAATGIQNGGADGVSASPLVQRMSAAYGQPQPPAEQAPVDDGYADVPQSMIDQANMQSLRNMSAMYLAAGQSMSGADRAQIIAKMSDDNDPVKNIYNMSQARLMNTQVADAIDKRKNRLTALDNLRSKDFGDTLTDKEKMVLESFLAAGDPDGANDFLSKITDQKNQSILLPDGTTTTKGLMQTDANSWNKTYLPKLETADGKLSVVSDMIDLLQTGMIAGQNSDWRVAAEKYGRMAGREIDPAALNREKFNSLAVDLTLQRMKALGGNDTEKEYENMSRALAGVNTETETVLNNLQTTAKRTIMDATIAGEQRRRIGSPLYGAPVQFTADLVPEPYKQMWDRVAGDKSNGFGYQSKGGDVKTDSGTPAPKSGTNSSFKHLWGG
jgi:hypothetical protein